MLRCWPWFTALLAALAIANPIGLDVVGSAIRQSPTDWLRLFWLWVTLGGTAAVVLLGALEIWARRRLAGCPRRRLLATTQRD